MKHKYIRKCKPKLNSREECTEFTDHLFQYFILETILKRFQRSFVQRHSIIRASYSIHSLFVQLSYIRQIFYTFHPKLSLHIYTGVLIFCAVVDPRNSQKNAKYREIRQKYFQIHVAKTYLILILAIRPVLFTPNVQIYLETSSLQ